MYTDLSRRWHDIFSLIKFQVHAIKKLFTSLHFTSLHLTSLHFTSLQTSTNYICFCFNSVNLLLVSWMGKYHWFGIQKRDTFQLQQGMIQRMSGKVSNPFWHHDGNHYRQQKLNVVCDFDLSKNRKSVWKISSRVSRGKLNKHERWTRVILDKKIILTIITVSDIVSLDTPPKNDAAPIKAKAPGSIHAHWPIPSKH